VKKSIGQNYTFESHFEKTETQVFISKQNRNRLIDSKKQNISHADFSNISKFTMLDIYFCLF